MSDPTNTQPEPIMDTASPYTSKAQHIKALMEYKRSLSMPGNENTTAPPVQWVEIPFRLPVPIRYPGPKTFHKFELLPDELKVHILVFILLVNWFIVLVDHEREETETRVERRVHEAKETMQVLRCVSKKMRRLASKIYYGQNWMLLQPSHEDGKVHGIQGSCLRFPAPFIAEFVEKLEIHVHLRLLDGLLMFPPGRERATFDITEFKTWQKQLASLKDLRIVVVDLDVSAGLPWTGCVPRQVQDLTTLDLVPERVQVEILRHMAQVPKYGSMTGCTEVPKGSDVPGLVKKMIQDRTGYKSEGITLIGVS
ncbi:hypothetical protein J1614_005470 [Plenodomus biglobosus]|nr:hypothetical protein J1614_005470 [Plenodomus biglobosus]